MTLLPKTLANNTNTLGTARTEQLYRVPRSLGSVLIKWMSLYNTDGSNPHTVKVYVNRRGVQTEVGRITLVANGGSARVIDRDEGLVLSPDDSIDINVDAADVVTYTLVGIEVP